MKNYTVVYSAEINPNLPCQQGDHPEYDEEFVLLDNGTPVWGDRMEPEDALLVRDLRPLVDMLNVERGRAVAAEAELTELRLVIAAEQGRAEGAPSEGWVAGGGSWDRPYYSASSHNSDVPGWMARRHHDWRGSDLIGYYPTAREAMQAADVARGEGQTNEPDVQLTDAAIRKFMADLKTDGRLALVSRSGDVYDLAAAYLDARMWAEAHRQSVVAAEKHIADLEASEAALLLLVWDMFDATLAAPAFAAPNIDDARARLKAAGWTCPVCLDLAEALTPKDQLTSACQKANHMSFWVIPERLQA